MLNIFDFTEEAPTSSEVLKLDVDGKLGLTVQSFIGQRTAILGSSGGGKTNTLALILEKVLPFMPTVIFDQHDEYWGLCEQYEILRVGKSEMSQIKAGPEQAVRIAEISHSKRMSVLVEMLDMSRLDRQDFVEFYCAHIWELNKRSKLPYGIVLEEAQNFIPEGRSTPAQDMMKQFALEGRKFGFSIFLSTQRSAEVSKTILAQCGLAFLHGVDIYPDVQAYAGMLPFTAAETKKIALNLAVGECIVKIKHDGPARFLHPVKMLRRETFHVGDTPTLDDEAPPLRAIDGELLLELKALLSPVDKKRDKSRDIFADASPSIEANIFYDKHVDSFIDDLRRQIDQLKRQPVAAPAAAKNSSKIDFSPEKPDVIVDAHKTALSGDLWEKRLESATTRAINKQQREFNSLVQVVKEAKLMHRLTLVYLTQQEGITFSERELSVNLGYKRSNFSNERPTGLERRGLIKRKLNTPRTDYIYESSARKLFEEQFPNLNTDELVQVICKLEKM